MTTDTLCPYPFLQIKYLFFWLHAYPEGIAHTIREIHLLRQLLFYSERCQVSIADTWGGSLLGRLTLLVRADGSGLMHAILALTFHTHILYVDGQAVAATQQHNTGSWFQLELTWVASKNRDLNSHASNLYLFANSKNIT